MDFKFEGNDLYFGDCLENYYKNIEHNSIQLICTDLPYGTTSCSWDSVLPLNKLWKMVNYLLKPNGTFITTASQPFTSVLVASNLEMFKYELIWHKSRKTGHVHAKNKPMKEHENILVFSKGTTVHATQSKNRMIYNPQGLIENTNKVNFRPSREIKGSNVVAGHRPSHKNTLISEYTNYPTSIKFVNSEHNVNALHETQKPVELMEYLIKTYSNEFDFVFDPCSGSATTLIACENLNRNYFGYEKDEEIYKRAKNRLDEHIKSKQL